MHPATNASSNLAHTCKISKQHMQRCSISTHLAPVYPCTKAPTTVQACHARTQQNYRHTMNMNTGCCSTCQARIQQRCIMQAGLRAVLRAAAVLASHTSRQFWCRRAMHASSNYVGVQRMQAESPCTFNAGCMQQY